MKFKELKPTLKNWAKEIRVLKTHRKNDKRGNITLTQIESEIFHLKKKYRHYHIVYCELRGKSRDQIEKPSIYNPASEFFLKNIKKDITDYNQNENVRNSA